MAISELPNVISVEPEEYLASDNSYKTAWIAETNLVVDCNDAGFDADALNELIDGIHQSMLSAGDGGPDKVIIRGSGGKRRTILKEDAKRSPA